MRSCIYSCLAAFAMIAQACGDQAETVDDEPEFVPVESELIAPDTIEIVGIECPSCGPHSSCSYVGPSPGECRCDQGYAGEDCDLCDDGYIEMNGSCVELCEAADVACDGVCIGPSGDVTCECAIGLTGADCDQCANGFMPDPTVFDGLACAPTCDGECAPQERCEVRSRDEQRCECWPGYERNGNGACSFKGFVNDGQLERGGSDWRLLLRVANTDHEPKAEMVPGQLTLSVDHVCSHAVAVTEAHLPVLADLPNAALVIEAKGNSGASLYAEIEGARFFLPNGGEAFEGTGEWKRYVQCVDLWTRTSNSALVLSVGESGTCEEELDAKFEVRSVALVSDERCATD